jgi:hypothetical protein
MSKARVHHSELPWFQAFEKIVAMGIGAKLEADGVAYQVSDWHLDTEFARLVLRISKGKDRGTKITLKRGDPLVLELKPR